MVSMLLCVESASVNKEWTLLALGLGRQSGQSNVQRPALHRWATGVLGRVVGTHHRPVGQWCANASV